MGQSTEHVDVAEEGKRIVEILATSGHFRMGRMAERMAACSKYRLALIRRERQAVAAGVEPDWLAFEGPIWREDMRSLPVGCRARACPACNAARRGKFDRRFRPQIQAMLADGHPVLFVTVTRPPIYKQRMRAAFDEFRACFKDLRYGRASRNWWSGLVAGGIYGLEATLYGRYPQGHAFEGQIRPGAYNGLDRRVHAHLHSVIVLQKGVDPHAAAAEIEARWLHESEHGLHHDGHPLEGQPRRWGALPAGQKLEVIGADSLGDNQNAARYCVKYIGKPADIRDALDALEMLEGCKGMRQVQAFGALHGAALRRSKAAATALELAQTAERDQRAEAAAVAALRAESAEAEAATVAEDEGRDAAQPIRLAAREDRWTEAIIASEAERDRADEWRAVGPSVAAALAEMKAAAAQARARSAAVTFERRRKWASTVTYRASRKPLGTAAGMRRAHKRRVAAARVMEAADYLERVRQHAAKTQRHDDGGRAVVLAIRAGQDVESERWRVAVRDDFIPAIQRQAHTETGAIAADTYGGVSFAVRDKLQALASAQACLESARERLLICDRTVAESAGGYAMPRDIANAEAAAAEAVEARQDVERAEQAYHALLNRLPLNVATIDFAGALGCARAAAVAAAVAAGDERAKERRRLAAEKRATNSRHGRQENVNGLPMVQTHRIPKSTSGGGSPAQLSIAACG